MSGETKTKGCKVPHDRTVKQQSRGYCLNPDCLEDSTDQRFEFDVDHDHFCCPKCGSDSLNMIGLLALIHLLVADSHGPIVGSGGQRFRFACSPTRAHLATVTNNEAATGLLASANCVQCLKAAHDQGIRDAGTGLWPGKE